MPTVDENKENWEKYHWDTQGDKWSEAWGTVDMQWYGTLLPRLHQFLPAGRILEIAPGYGRWTQYLKDQCDHIVIVDLVEKCIGACKERFAECNHIDYHVNDGKSLDMVADDSIDLVFSFDSLVHAEDDVIRDYLKQFSRKLTPDGIGFIHHSNLGECHAYLNRIEKVSFAKNILYRLRLIDHITNWRAGSMTTDKFNQFAADAGLQCLTQEKLNWGRSLLTDCISVFTPKDSRHARPRRVLANPDFRKESDYLRKLDAVYRLGE